MERVMVMDMQTANTVSTMIKIKIIKVDIKKGDIRDLGGRGVVLVSIYTLFSSRFLCVKIYEDEWFSSVKRERMLFLSAKTPWLNSGIVEWMT